VSFLVDPVLLYAQGELYARRAPERAQGRAARAAGAGVLTVFYAVSVPCYLNRRWTRPLWRAFPSSSGRDFMVNSGVLRLPVPRSAGGHALAALVFATYPLWLLAGYRRGRRARLARP
jgi:hypothetical protein